MNATVEGEVARDLTVDDGRHRADVDPHGGLPECGALLEEGDRDLQLGDHLVRRGVQITTLAMLANAVIEWVTEGHRMMTEWVTEDRRMMIAITRKIVIANGGLL